jgi:hypothetical protein
MRSLRMALTAGLALVVPLAMASPAAAHERRRVGRHDVVVGWLEEPAYAGFQNAVQFIVSRNDRPVEDATLEVVVLFGEEGAEERTESLALEPAFGSPGEFHATVIPTRPGTYTFEISGEVEGDELDETFTSSPDTFNDIQEPRDVQFPARDPSSGELGQAVERLRTEQAAAESEASRARTLGLAGIGLGAVALIVAVLRGRRATPR